LRKLLWIRSKVLIHLPISYLALGVGTLTLSFAAMYIRWAQAPGVVTGFYRLSLSTFILLPFAALRRPTTQSQVSWLNILPPILSGMYMAANFALWNTSLFHTTVANASILGNITPLWVCIVAWGLFHEHLSQRFWMGLLAIFLGVALITNGSSLLHPHPGVEIICRDRVSAYAEAAQLSAPSAQQVADRFHLSMNLTGVVKKTVE
jgi:drug/metabolite transporter (DMT)-like permease